MTLTTYVPASNQIATFGSSAITYDSMGNVDALRGINYTYDAGGRLDTAYEIGSVRTLAADYNALGELAKTVTTTPDPCGVEIDILLSRDYYNFTPDGRALHIVAESTVSVETDYIWVDGIPVAQFRDSYDSSGVYQSTVVTYLYSDHLGTPRLGTDTTGALSYRIRTDAFGQPAQLTGQVVRLRMPGQVTLGLVDLNYNYFRQHDSQAGRYLESDPIGLDGGLNTYGYAGLNPLALIDPLGVHPPIAGCTGTAVRGIRSRIEEARPIPHNRQD